MAALSMVVMLPEPSDAGTPGGGRAWPVLEEALRPLVARNGLGLERLPAGSENALKRRLMQSPFDILHFVGCGSSRSAAQYGTLAFEDSGGRSRNVNAQYLAGLLKQHAGLRLLVLQGCQEGDDPLGPVADTLAALGVPAVVSTPHLDGAALACFIETFYGALVDQASGDEAVRMTRDALTRRAHPVPGLRLRAATPGWHLVAPREPEIAPSAHAASAPRGPGAVSPAAEAGIAAREAAAARRIAEALQHKRAAGEFDVFLCHNWADKPAVKKIAQQLMASGILPWLDEWELPPGRPWQPLLEQQIEHIKSAAVFVGAAGVGPWQEQELYGFLREFVSRQAPVIPVLLENAPEKPALPIFLKAMTWVDFRVSDPAPVERLVWGITGKRGPESAERT